MEICAEIQRFAEMGLEPVAFGNVRKREMGVLDGPTEIAGRGLTGK